MTRSTYTHKLSFALLIAFTISACAAAAHAQRARTTTTTTTSSTATQESETAEGAPVATAPQTFKAKYEGGIFGYNRKIEGTLNFDDPSNRLIFKDKQGKELFSIPYSSVVATFPDTRSRTSTGGRVVSSIPTPYGIGQVGRLFRSKSRYMTLQYNDPDTEAAGTTSFKISDKELLESVVNSVAAKAGLVRRGEIFVRRKATRSTSTVTSQVETPPTPR